MSSNQKIVNDPILNDFIYTVLFNASYDQKRGLRGKYLKAAVNERSAKLFATKSSKEEKEHILSHFGYNFFYVISKNSTSVRRLKELLLKFDFNKKVSVMKDLADEGLFVSADKDFIRLLSTTANAVHHPSFFYNLEFIRQGFHIKKWAKRNNNKEDSQSRESLEATMTISKLALATSLTMLRIQSLYGVTKREMDILLYLNYFGNAYITDAQLVACFSSYITKHEFRFAIKALLAGDLIQKHASAKERQYMITGLGQRKINEFLETITHPNII